MSEIDFEVLKTAIVNVTFTKKDGSERVMRCTQDMGFLEESELPTGNGVPYTSDQVRVFDLDIAQWRSFLKDSVTSFVVERITKD